MGGSSDFMEMIKHNLYEAFYQSTPEERLLFSKLSTTYTLLFCLNTEPRLIEYFQNMASDFYLYVGSDVLVRALSERYLRREDQGTRNALDIIRSAGGKLILTEPVLEEVYAHIERTDWEFVNNYEYIESSITQTIIENIDRILIQSYFYAKNDPPIGINAPRSWVSFIHQFCDYELLHKPAGYQQIKTYLMSQFHMSFESREEVKKLCDLKSVEELTALLINEKSDERLARNDALMAHAIYGRRNQMQEYSTVSEFGLRTWWLTGESRILKYTSDLVKHHNSRYMMRPEFILNFLTLAPSASEVRNTYKHIFPTSLGIQLARRVDPDELQKVLGKLREAHDLEPGRRMAAITQACDQLKSDFSKKYEHNFS